MSAKKHIKWSEPPLLEMLKTRPCREIARYAKCTQTAVRQARLKLGIENPFKPSSKPRIRNPEQIIPFFGVLTDQQIADKFGSSNQQVASLRRKLGLPTTRIDWSKVPLGTLPDNYFAKYYGVGCKVVMEARDRRGIAPWSEERTCACGTAFFAKHFRQRFCSYKCQRYHWQLVKDGDPPEIADVKLALRRLRNAAKGK